MERAVATASVFSGRPDPRWEISPTLAAELERLWEELEAHVGPRPSPAPLGYRGCELILGDVTYAAFGGVVGRSDGERDAARADPARRFERLLLESAPAGSLPPGTVPPEGGT